MQDELISTFLAVVREGTLSKAAEVMFLSQSTVSNRIQNLEKQVGAPLFIRNKGTREMVLTTTGRSLVNVAKEIDNGYRRIADLGSLTRKRTIRIGSMNSLNRELLAPLHFYCVEALQNSLVIRFRTLHSAEIYKRVREGQVDVGFAFRPFFYDFISVCLFSEPMQVITSDLAGAKYPAAVDLEDLKKSDEIQINWNDEIENWHNRNWPAEQLPIVRVDSCELLINFLSRYRDTWAIAPASFARELVEKKTARILTVRNLEPMNRSVYVMYKKENRDKPEIVEYIHCVKTFFENEWGHAMSWPHTP